MVMDSKHARELFTLDEENGVLIWNDRPRHHFETAKGFRIFKTRFSGKPAGSKDGKGYIRINVDGVGIRAHRIVWLMVHGVSPLGEVDHINGNPADNRPSNLRLVKNWENARNRKTPKHNTSGRIGVSFRRDLGRWSATIGKDGKAIALGFFDTIEEAIAARVGAEKALGYHKNHGRMNNGVPSPAPSPQYGPDR